MTELPRLLDDLGEATNGDLLPPQVQAALVHAQFETMHPFDDGNRRTGRALIHVVLRRRGVAPECVPPLSVVLSAHRDRYIRGLSSFRGDDVLIWIEQFAEAAMRSAQLASRHLHAVDTLMSRWRAKLRTVVAPRADAAAWAIIEVLPAHPVITAPVAAAATRRSKGLYAGLEQLQDAGVLIPLSRSTRRQSWEASGLFGLLERMETDR